MINLIFFFGVTVIQERKKIKVIIKRITLLLEKKTLTLSEYVVWKTKIAGKKPRMAAMLFSYFPQNKLLTQRFLNEIFQQ